MTDPTDGLAGLIAQIVEETNGAPSMVLYDGKSYKAVPTELTDQLEAALIRLRGAQREEKKDDPRVAPSVPCVESVGSTAERQTGAVTAAERTEREHCVCPDCGGGWTFDFGERRVYCRTCEGGAKCNS